MTPSRTATSASAQTTGHSIARQAFASRRRSVRVTTVRVSISGAGAEHGVPGLRQDHGDPSHDVAVLLLFRFRQRVGTDRGELLGSERPRAIAALAPRLGGATS